MSEMLAEIPPEYRQPVAETGYPELGSTEFTPELNRVYGLTEKAVADVAIEGSGLVEKPDIGVGVSDGTFWHGSNQLLESGDRLLPASEVPDSVHAENKLKRPFNSSSSPTGSQYNEGEKDFAFGYPREAGYLPTSYGKHIYKVSSPETSIVNTGNGPEVWAKGGGTIVKRMHPDFAANYDEAKHRVDSDKFQLGLPGMESGMQLIAENELDVSGEEFRQKYPRHTGQDALSVDSTYKAGPEDVAIPGFEDYGKPAKAPAKPNESIM